MLLASVEAVSDAYFVSLAQGTFHCSSKLNKNKNIFTI